MAYIVLRIRGTINIPYWAEKTMQLLNLDKRYRATIVSEDPAMLGMLKKVKNYVAWYKADKELIKELLEKRGLKSSSKRLDDNAINSLGFDNIDKLAEALASNNIKLSSLDMKPWFGLHPPRGGFKRSTKRLYTQKGVTGENPELPELIRRML
ncbi:MAG: 50S ribosomal protein L30 [Candidatus Nitrosocaldaceae archaeon]|nr:MAG: 50S ribosomal protein L30 [Candidatus Nitrosocaldaceae archaeon]